MAKWRRRGFICEILWSSKSISPSESSPPLTSRPFQSMNVGRYIYRCRSQTLQVGSSNDLRPDMGGPEFVGVDGTDFHELSTPVVRQLGSPEWLAKDLPYEGTASLLDRGF